MNLESLKLQLIEKIVATKDETMLKNLEQTLSENPITSTVATPKKENGIVQRRSVYRIADRPKVIAAKPTKIAEPVRVIQTNSDSSLSKLQRLVREQALSNQASDA